MKNRKKIKKICQLCRVLMQKHSAKWPSHVSRTSTLPSAKVLALGKYLKVYRVPGLSTRQSDHVAGPWEAALPSARRRHSAKSPPRVAPRGSYAEGQGSRQSLCRVSASARNPTLGKDPFAVRGFAEWCLPRSVCRVQTGLCRV